MKYNIINRSTVLLVLVFCALNLFAQISGGERHPFGSQSVIINDNWFYLEKDSEQIPTESDNDYEKIALPHTWNAQDVLETKDYRRAGSWYRKYLTFSKEQLDQRQYLKFNAAGQQAKVYLNGEELIHHIGGYSAFICELTGKLKPGKNKIDVWVSNADSRNIAPRSGDFNFYGGLYRSVELISSPKLTISKKYFASSGVRVWSEKVSADLADLHISARVDNGTNKRSKIEIIAIVQDKMGHVVSTGKSRSKVNPGTTELVKVAMTDVVNPSLWSPEHPELYQVKIELHSKGQLLDEVVVNHGFRWYEFTADKGFFLNGKAYKLKGLNRHQDNYGEGNAVSLEHHLRDIKLIKELGVNWLRLAHYQQDDYVLQLCDKMGILVWEEIPYVNKTSFEPEFEQNLQSMMKDLINQHFNHSCIILWGMGNEVWMGDRGDGKANIYDIVKNLNDLVHSEDPVRKTVFVNGDNNRPIDFKVYEIPDVFGYNLYRGWYGTHYNTFTERVNELHAMMPNKPLIISEFGAGSDVRVHTENPLRQDFSIEYQNNFLESHLNQIDKIDWLCGVNWWSFADFGAAHRGDTKPHINQKGLVTFDRHKKDIFYLLKSKWSKEPVLYLETPTWEERGGDANKVYRVFTNMNEVELFHNGKSLGKQTNGFKWNVVLTKGINKLKAIGVNSDLVKEHGFELFYDNTVSEYTVKASGESVENPASFLIDRNPETFWCAKGDCFVELDLQRIRLVNGLKIQFYNLAKTSYKLKIQGSVDGENWKELFSGTSNKNAQIESFIFSKQEEIRYLKVEGSGNNLNDVNNYREISPILSFEKQEKNLYEKVGAGE
ncbi:glycoside hydrolase family 2 TIM barrel-domain containing protein [Ancylomarina sp. 16SWW S1-10-2]|uniref:glycoside hydrolase family 2 TIM barrel-domain containing protein n=1 Tax=Ancylomarina sp. 16SWW S1-10-2 TaxID=2499681 RepID=UPI0012AD7AB8|nr:glycoside hydrolase family 2 TIM barrel-domain containing protein [Ancylomarina sp. 16SWW S1-10-2]MRT91978.1 DUF4982 domain-containing protein [Ancylomarina sp. 16SWW S1-10-2]